MMQPIGPGIIGVVQPPSSRDVSPRRPDAAQQIPMAANGVFPRQIQANGAAGTPTNGAAASAQRSGTATLTGAPRTNEVSGSGITDQDAANIRELISYARQRREEVFQAGDEGAEERRRALLARQQQQRQRRAANRSSSPGSASNSGPQQRR